MRPKIQLAALILAGVTLTGCQSLSSQTGAPVVVTMGRPGEASTSAPMSSAAKGVTLPYAPGDVAFISGMITHHAQAIEMVNLLKSRTDSESMRMMALRIEVSQNDEIAWMRRWLEERKQPLPAEHAHHMPGGMMPGMLTDAEMTKLAAAKGPEFDRLFLEGMIKHHMGALIMVEELFNAPGSAQQADMFDFASHVDADQRMEISRMTQMLKDMKDK
ncbi:MAG: DUF305 domain-containing protein [Acidobacteria bacterium]|nr:DUF305 domain-containing protein [Acidobacteriota bacterium]